MGAKQMLFGSLLPSVSLVIISLMLAAFAFGFLPLRIPPVESLLAAETTQELLRLFVPTEITAKTYLAIAVSALLYLFLVPPFELGMSRFFLEVSRGGRPKFLAAFRVFTDLKSVFSSIGLYIIVAAVTGVYTLLFSVIPIVATVCAVYLQSAVLAEASMLLLSAAAVFSVLWCSRFSFATYVLAANGGHGALAAFSKCLRLTRNKKREVCLLRGSFFLWDYLSASILPLMLFYRAYYMTTWASYLAYFEQSEATPQENSAEQENI